MIKFTKAMPAFILACLIFLPVLAADEVMPLNPYITMHEEGEAATFIPAPPEIFIDADYDPDMEEEPFDPNVEPEEEILFDDEILAAMFDVADALAAVNGKTNILLIGSDARPGEKKGRSDTMIILTLDADNQSVKLTSFMRDLYVEIPGRKNNRMNAAFAFGGADLLKRTIERNFGIEVDYYVTVDFYGLASVIDQIGGLVLDVEPKYVRRVNAVIEQDNKVLKLPKNDGLLTGSGEQLMTGKQAQAYARYRYGTPDGDFGRTRRQREVIMKAIGKIKDLSTISLVRLATNNIDKIDTDMEITEMVRLAPALFKLADMDVKELRIPIDRGFSSKRISGMAVLVPDRKKTLQAITEFLDD